MSGDDTRTTRSKKVRAVLAGGLVLGIGAAVTLAAWNDSEYARGDFSAGAFDLEGSTDGADYGEHPAADSAAALAFSVDPSNLAPGDSVSAPFAVRLDDTTTYDAVVDVLATSTSGDVSNLTYSLVQTDSFGCGQSTAATLVPSGTAVGQVPGAPQFDLTAGDGTAGQPVTLCFTVKAGSGLEQGQTGSATWEFAAESQA
ncbi:SipW-dependent-type signal peptide-containing protein [Brachybacterium sp. NPDC056505]|uniref:SipW-dependent-type signal peptide-containing protein n=1 Tax=Brachybacterium sp. NPDC056505 TaxID=3345843 RepID=UPI00366CA736